MKRRRKGFTLIELVMVIVILGILASVALPRFISLQSDARDNATKGALGAIRAALAIQYAASATSGTAAYPSAIVQSMFADSIIPYEKAAQASDDNSIVTSANNNGLSTANAAGWYYNSADGQVYVNHSAYTSW